jgi:hypothetical protein
MSPVRSRSLAPEASALEMPAESGVLELPSANFARVHDRLDRIETRLGELTSRVAAIGRDLVAMKSATPRPSCALTIWIAGSSASRSG